MPDFSVSIVDVGDAQVVRLYGELDLVTAEGLAERLIDIRGTLVIDLSGLTFMDSSGITALVIAKRTIEEAGDKLTLVRPSPNVARVLEVTGLDGWVETLDLASEARFGLVEESLTEAG
jgi:anti-anti-sigma factor